MNIGVNKSNMSFTNRNDLPSFYGLATPVKKTPSTIVLGVFGLFKLGSFIEKPELVLIDFNRFFYSFLISMFRNQTSSPWS
jgi:hypothetical protein